MILLETERLTLRTATENDAPFMLELLNSRGFIEGIADRGIRTPDEARAYIRERVVSQYEAYGFGMWLVSPNGEPEPVGLAGLVKRDVLPHVDIGYAFLEHVWGRGYAQEAAGAVLRYARETLKLETICAVVNPDNAASRRVLEKLGLRYVETLQLAGWDAPSDYFTT